MTMSNMDKIRSIIDTQIDKIKEASDKSKMPLSLNEINSLTALAKLVADGDKLERKTENKLDSFSDEELLLIQQHRKKKREEL